MNAALFRFASSPEDFEVEELPLVPPSGDGRFLWLLVEKRGLSTEEAASRLAHALGVPRRAAAYAGRKDVHARTIQWMSFDHADEARGEHLRAHDDAWEPSLRILAVARHPRGLALGASRGNRFSLVLRDLAPGASDIVAERLSRLVRDGAPARFGEQRMGAGGANAAAGLALLRGDCAAFLDALLRGAGNGEHGRVAEARDAVIAGDLAAAERLFPASYSLERHACRRLARGDAAPDIVAGFGRRELVFLVNAGQAALFNAVVDRRSPDLGRLVEGDVAYIHASRGSFVVTDLVAETPRAERLEISPTGPLFGRRMRPRPRGEALAIEESVLAAAGLDESSFERHLPSRHGPWRVDGSRRPLRWPLRDARLEVLDDDGHARLVFTLPPGGYATEVVRALGGEAVKGVAAIG